jgi:mono/diheme cytochrome c family protein
MRAATRFPKAAAAIATTVALGSSGCSQEDDAKLSDVAKQGEAIYQNVCIACHHGDPNRDGALGPANAGASPELLAAKILRGEYPPGYTPKRPGSNTMPRFEYLADQIPALAAYLAEVKE